MATVAVTDAEFEGIIIGVYKINNWYPSKTNNNKRNNRWGFNGEEASIEIKEIYFNSCPTSSGWRPWTRCQRR